MDNCRVEKLKHILIYVLAAQTEGRKGTYLRLFPAAPEGLVGGAEGRERGDITWLALTQFNIQDMSALWKMQLHVSQWDAAFIHAEKMYI